MAPLHTFVHMAERVLLVAAAAAAVFYPHPQGYFIHIYRDLFILLAFFSTVSLHSLAPFFFRLFIQQHFKSLHFLCAARALCLNCHIL